MAREGDGEDRFGERQMRNRWPPLSDKSSCKYSDREADARLEQKDEYIRSRPGENPEGVAARAFAPAARKLALSRSVARSSWSRREEKPEICLPRIDTPRNPKT